MRSLVRCAFLIAPISLAGCFGGGTDIKVAPVSGTVTYNGSPLAGATVTFVPETGAVAAGVTDVEGYYELRTGALAGAIVGNHTVTVQSMVGESEEAPNMESMDPGSPEFGTMMEQMAEGMEEEKPKSLIPERYGSTDTSGLSFAVEDTDNVINIELVD